nr:polyadenylate-binding protein 2-like [Ipomoea batatas]
MCSIRVGRWEANGLAAAPVPRVGKPPPPTAAVCGSRWASSRNQSCSTIALRLVTWTERVGLASSTCVQPGRTDDAAKAVDAVKCRKKLMIKSWLCVDASGISRGSGFCCLSQPREASRALSEMIGKMVVSKPLYVALAQRKEERRARLQPGTALDYAIAVDSSVANTEIGLYMMAMHLSEQNSTPLCAAQFSQMRPVAMAPSLGPRMPMYPPGAPGIGQQLFYGSAPPAIIPPQAGFGYQQQLVPGMRPGGGPMPNFFVPMVQQGQQAQRQGGRRGAGPGQQAQQPMPLMQQQMLPRGRMYRFPPGRNVPEVPVPGVAGGMLSVPYDMGGILPRDATMGQPVPITALASALANAPPEQQRTMLGENLYPLVDQLEHEHAAKVTGMLLEMDQTEVLHLLESPEALKSKVAEAMDVLRNVQQQQASSPADQLASLSLNENLVS